MLNINEENVLKDLEIIKSKIDTASLEDCIETLQLLVKSMFFLKEKKLDTYTEKEWESYCKIRYNLGRHFVDVIRMYNEKISKIVNERYYELESESINILDLDQQSDSRISESISTSNIPYNDTYKYNYSESPKSNIVLPQHNATYSYSSNSSNNRTIIRSSTLPSNLVNDTTIYSPIVNYNNDISSNNFEVTSRDIDINRNTSYASHSAMTSSSNLQDDDDNDDDIDSIVGKYVCTKEFKAVEDFHIDLQVNDTVTVNQFSGKYILGKNCSSGAEGLFPIYYIDSLDGNYVFFRCKEEMEFASVDDQIFLLREADNNYYPGYNITKGEQGIFCLSKLEPIIMDDAERSKYESIYNKEIHHDDTYLQINQSIYNSNGSIDLDDNNAIADPILPTNTVVSTNNNNNNSSSNNNNNNNNNNNSSSNNNNNNNNNNDDVMFQLSIYKDVTDGINGQIDQSIVEKLLEYYKTIPNLQEDTFKKTKSDIENNLYLMRDAIKKFQEFREDKNDMDYSSKDSFSFQQQMDVETLKKKWEANRYRCQELVETEKSYSDKMRIMIEKFMKPLESVVDTENEMLNRVQISLIFKNIPDIYEFSYKLYQELAEAFTHYDEEGPIPIATVFLNKFSEWKIYIKYVEDFHFANRTLENLKKSPQTDRFNRFMEQCQKSEEHHRSHLKELIILPIQRFLKYRLLFEGIKKDSNPKNIESYNLLDTVENYVFEIGEIMNNAKRIQENINKMFSLEKTIMNYPPELISYTQRSFIGEWNISEILKNKRKKIYLFSDTVLIAAILNKKKNKKYKYAYENRIDILNYTVSKSVEFTSTRTIKFNKVGESGSGTTDGNLKPRTNHSHSILGFSLSNHSETSITKLLIFFETKEACDEFVQKYNEQRRILLKKETNETNNEKINFNKDC
ncbi:hypothetical protein BCR36DRAFT_330113 [Piromyces finnis]|uniref:DH domain-containing protein n=1 Tax=Piromyces finnis TaxID=1754191 RepID=A0A1Y1V7M8_9FUNG|nr:hypothetical protein BCR36DRAFT_330113 [Piromyces finnis]|eukprot:ORX47903.1 hypothetical protein BCR36DRAFT_330113 [Piromyces finnis]